MEDINALVAIGKGMGLTGTELSTFVDKREAMIREAEREKQKIEREERLREREERMKEKEFAELEKQAHLKIELAEKEIELAKIKADSKTDTKLKSIDIKAKLPKLPPFSDGKDNMDAYLKRFERFATSAEWPKKEWATNLSALLQGKALDVYSRLSSTEALDYDKLCEALLKRYQLTEEGFRQKFRTSKQEPGETAGQFAVRLSNYLSRWMEIGKVKETHEDLRDLILREQFLSASNKNLVLFLKERKIRSIKEMVEFAEQYNEAHTVGDVSARQTMNRTDSRTDVPKRETFRNTLVDDNRTQKTFRERYCYGCGGKDHFIKSCPKSSLQSPRSNSKAAYLEVSETQKEVGKNTDTDQEFGDRETEEKSVATCIVITPTNNSYTLVSSEIESKTNVNNSDEIEIVNLSCQGTGKVVSKKIGGMPVREGYVGNRKVSVLRDSGCNSVLVKESLVMSENIIDKRVRCVLADGTKRAFPVAHIEVSTPFFVGPVEALCMKNPVYDLVLGNIKGVRSPDDPDMDWKYKMRDSAEGKVINNHTDATNTEVSAVETRAQKQKNKVIKPLVVPDSIQNVSHEQVSNQQMSDDTLSNLTLKANTGEVIKNKNGSLIKYFTENGLYYRQYTSSGENPNVCKQLLVPQNLRNDVLHIAHDGIMSGHFGIRKTTNKVLSDFYWPSLRKDVRLYCRSCDVCQKTIPKGRISKLPLGKMPLIDTPFSRVAIDLIGPIHPPTEDGHRFILTVVDYATRYPEAIALKRIDTETIAESLVDIYSRVGVPREVLSDQGKQFTSDLMKEVSRILSVKQLTTTPYHPACNGLVERFNGTLKSMLRKLCEEQPRQWNRYISALLFAYRDATQDSTGYSPFQLLYGRQVRGPLTILKELWTKEIRDEEVKTTYQYVVDLRQKLEDTCQLAQEELSRNSKRYKFYADANAKERQFKPGDEVLLLLPSDNNKLLMQWRGPFTVIDKVNPYDYKINIKGKVKTYHGNMLQKYNRRNERGCDSLTSAKDHDETLVCVSVIDETDSEELTSTSHTHKHGEVRVQFPSYTARETVRDVQVGQELSSEQKQQVDSLLFQFPDVFTDIPGTTELVEHEIAVTSDQPIRSKQYPVPYALKEDIKKEIENMLQLGIIEPSNSPYASPVVMVKKSDGSYRFCCDFRKLNSVTIFDAEPIGNPDAIFAKLTRVPNQARIESVIWLAPNETRPINSLMYPLYVPGDIFHETTIETAIGYSVVLKNIEVDFPEGINCTESHLQIIDQSLVNDTAEILEVFTCDNSSDKTKAIDNQIIDNVKTYLNVMKLKLRSAGDNNNNETLKFKAALVSEIDPDYLNKTMHDRGSFKRCDDVTCGNYGNCTAVGHERFTCTCHPQYAGLFCQTTKCGLKPCIHGNCSLISTGFKCGCEKGWWGSRCNMDDFVCQYKQCSGHGQCVEVPEKENISCNCHQGWSGSRCEIAIPETPEQLTIGQKLLKEPIWIGMIVMLNLVLFFCVSYVARRKCGKKIAKLMPKRKKPTDNTSKDASHSKEESSTTTRDIYSLQIELPRSETSSKSPSSINPTKFLFEKVDTSAPPTPVVVKEQKKEVALRFFEAYKSNNSNNRLSQSFDLSAGIQDGTVSFIDGDDDTEKKDSSPAMIRSYTISSLDHGPSTAKKRWKNLLRQTRSLPGSPEELRTSLERKRNKEDVEKATKPVSAEHCYPIIRILNENNHEEHRNSDSENSIICSESKRDAKSLINAPSDNQVNYVRHGDSADSGYPTTSVSSQNTQFGGVNSTEQIKTQSAGERRKLFGNKAKSKSFYNISYGDGRLSAETSSFSTDLDYESKASGLTRSLSRELDSSFDSGHYCLMCRRDRKLDHAESYSCESELNKLHMSDRTYSSDSRLSRKCNCRKCRRRGRSHCRKHIRQFSTDINSLSTSISNRYSEGNVKRSRHKGHRRSSERPTICNSVECAVAHSRSFRDYSSIKLSTSTESEACDCSKSNTRSRRKCYKRIEHYSDGTCAPRSRRPNLSSIANSAASWEQSKDETYKRRLMDSYLSNVRSSGYPYKDRYLSVDGLEHFDPSVHTSGSHLSTDSYQSKHNSFGSSKSHSPMADISEQLSRNRPSHLTDVEVVSQNLSNDPEYETRSVDKLEKTPLSLSSSGSDGTSKGYKDSAYQTKQSSMDRFNSIKDRNTTSKTINKQPEVSNRNDDRVRRHLHQAAQKLAMIKYFRNAQEQLSKDSAICTFSEDDLSTDDPDPRSLRPLVKRTSGLAFQMKEMNLSEVKEECSGVSHGSYVNTPNNEPSVDQPDKHRDESKVLIPLSSLCKSASQPDISYLDETKV